MGLKQQGLERLGQAFVQAERLLVDQDATGFDLGHIEQVVDDGHQALGRVMGH